jgi:hypothetical protein
MQGIFHEDPSAALVTSYRAMTLLASPIPTSALLTFLGRQAGTITTSLFDVFRPDAQGNFFHACRILDKLLQTHRDEVSKALTGATGIDPFLSHMLSCIEYAPCGEIFCNIICRPKQPYNIGPSSPHIYDWSPEVKWKLFSALSGWRLMSKLAQHTYSSAYSVEHSLAAATVFVELISRLSMDDNGEILLMPIAHCPELLQVLLLTKKTMNICTCIAADRSSSTKKSQCIAAALQQQQRRSSSSNSSNTAAATQQHR